MSNNNKGSLDINIPSKIFEAFGSGSTLKMNKYFKYLFYAGFGLCVLLIFILIISLLTSFGSSDEEAIPVKTVKSVETDGEYTLFPGLFKVPITLLQRDIDIDIEKEKTNRIEKMKTSICSVYNTELQKISEPNEYFTKYKETISDCLNNKCLINASYLMGECKPYDTPGSKPGSTGDTLTTCSASYISDFMINPLDDGLCNTDTCTFTQYDNIINKKYEIGGKEHLYTGGEEAHLCIDREIKTIDDNIKSSREKKNSEKKGYKISIG